MITDIIDFLMQIIIQVIDFSGYLGIILLMLISSCGIPLPSEIIMAFSGFLVADGEMNFWPVALMGVLGSLLGSWLAYYIGLKGGRPFIEKYGKFVLISKHDLNLADKWFVQYGQLIVFVGRLLPIIRTYISFPAGIAKMNFKKFSLYTFLGVLPWCVLFAWLGVKMGAHWEVIREKMHDFDLIIGAAIITVIALYIYRHIRQRE